MGSLISGSGSTSNASDISGLQSIAQGQVNLSNIDQSLGANTYNQGQSIYTPAYGQYISGATGQLTPADQALVQNQLSSANTATNAVYSNLGLGGSTMNTQDLNANSLKSEAEQANLNALNESLGLSGLSTANQYYGTANQSYSNAGNALSGASSSLTSAGNLSDFNLASLESAISSLGNKSSSGLGSGISSLVGGATGTAGTGSALGSLLGTSTGSGVVDTGAFSLA